MLPTSAVDKWNATIQEMKRGLQTQGNLMMDECVSLENRIARVEGFLKTSKSVSDLKATGLPCSQEPAPHIPRSVYLMSPKPFVTASSYSSDNSRPSSALSFYDALDGDVEAEERPQPTDAATDSRHNQDVETLPRVQDVVEKEFELKPPKPLVRKTLKTYKQSQETLLRSAAKDGDQEKLRSLISSGVDPNAKSDGGVTALHLAIMRNQVDCIRILLESGVDVNGMDNFGQTPLIRASASGNAASLRLLLERRARISLKDHNGRSALHAASAWGHSECVELLLRAGVRVGDRDHGGRTALHVAAASNKAETVSTLLKAGANKMAVTNDGRRARDFAESEEVKYLLRK